MRAALYIRVSTDEQSKEGFSIQAQTLMLERKAAEYGYTIVKHYVDDGYSAKNMKRPHLQKMLADSELKLFDVIFFWRLDRLTRSSRDFHKLAERTQKNSVGIRSATESIDTTTAIGRFQLELSVSLAQLERETISERTSFVMEERARKGLRNGSFAPFGYDLDGKDLIVNEENAKVVRRIFDLYLDHTGMKKIAAILNREGVLSAFNKLWSAPAIKYVLENPVYISKIRWNYQSKTRKKGENQFVTDANHESIIDELTFERVQNAIALRKYGGKRVTHDNLFSSILRCGRCGKSFNNFSYIRNGYYYKSYRCSSRYDYGTCDMQSISEKKVVEAFLKSLDLEDADYEKYFVMPDTEKDDHDKIESIRKELELINTRKKKWQLAYANDAMTLEELKQRTDEDRAREQELKDMLVEAPAAVRSHLSKEELIGYLKQLRSTWHLINNDKAKKTFIQEAFEYITVDTEPMSKVGQGVRTSVMVTDFKFRT